MLNFLFYLLPAVTFLALGLDSLHMQARIPHGQWGAIILTLAYLVLTLRLLSRERQLIVLCFVAVATVGECLFSLVFHLYEYRLSNIPIYVPLAHPLLLVQAWVLADVPLLKQYEVSLAKWMGRFHVLMIALVLVVWGDTLSLAFGLFGLYIFRRRRFSLTYGLMGFIVLALELLGTQLGCWQWAASSAGGWLHSTNPPYGAFLGYVAADIASIKLARKISAQWFPSLQIVMP